MSLNLLYVCDGNIIRSPAAEIITMAKAQSMGIDDLIVNSAGMRLALMHDGTPLTHIKDEVARALGEFGYGYHYGRKARALDNTANQQDLILCFEDRHVQEILKLAPNLDGKIHTLAEYAGAFDAEIRDPNEFIREIKRYRMLKRLPFALDLKYLKEGIADPNDEKRVMRIYKGTIRNIEFYVGKALEKMLYSG